MLKLLAAVKINTSAGVRRCSASSISKTFDVGIVGGGIVGLATARELKLKHPNLKICVMEKEKLLSMHQSGHNSGVIHAGIYYAPGSLKAKLCVEGLHLAYKYLAEKNIPYKKCGKLIVATNQTEVARLGDLMKRGLANNVPNLSMIEGDQIKKIEPNCVGLKAIHSPETGIVDWRQVSLSFAKDFEEMGGVIFLEFEVNSFTESIDNSAYPVHIQDTKGESIQCKYVITCGGLQSDRLAVKSGCSSNPKIVPFRGDYLVLRSDRCSLVNGNIYPVPDPRFPFLGVHFTPRIDGSVWLGPNAVLSFKREGYGRYDFNSRDFLDAVTYGGMVRIGTKYLTVGINEMINVLFISSQVKALKKFVPSLRVEDVQRGPSGVRAQALSPEGNLVDDFVFDQGTSSSIGARVLHVRNAPSPAATSSLTIAQMISQKAQKDFQL